MRIRDFARHFFQQAVFGAALVAAVSLADPVRGAPASWRYSNPRPHGANVNDLLVFENEVWQAGERGQIFKSSDLVDWVPVESQTRQSLRALTAFGTKIFFSGAEGTIVSAQGAETSVLSLGTTDWLEGIAASASALVAVGDNGAIYASEDGQAWTRRGNFSTWFRSVAFGAGRFVAVGENGARVESADGRSWVAKPALGVANLNRVQFVGQNFWVLGERGTVFTNQLGDFVAIPLGVTNNLYAVTGNSDEVIVAGDQIVLRADLRAKRWSQQSDSTNPSLAPEWPFYSAVAFQGSYLLAGRAGQMTEGFRTNENAALLWYSDTQPTRSWLWGVTRAEGMFAAAGADGVIVTSQDGVEWVRESVPDRFTNTVFLGIGGKQDSLLVAGSGGALLRSDNLLTNLVSTNAQGGRITNQVSLLGLAWTALTSRTTEDLQGIAAGDPGWVVAGAKGTILFSADGRNWARQNSRSTEYLSSAAYWSVGSVGSAGYVVVGDRGTILTSPQGTAWTAQKSGVTNWIYAVRPLGGRLVAVGSGGLILSSTDARQWVRASSGTDAWLNDITLADGKWFVVGTGGQVLVSTDFIQWTIEKTATSKSLYGAAAHAGRVVVAGLEGVILRTQTGEAAPVQILDYRTGEGVSTFLFGGALDQQFRLETSDSLQQPWEPVSTLEFRDGTGTLFHQTGDPDGAVRFYRVRPAHGP